MPPALPRAVPTAARPRTPATAARPGAVATARPPARSDQPSDAPLLAGARRGDPEAVAELYARHHAPLVRLAQRHAFADYSAQDLVAEAFARMLQAVANGHGPTDNARGYLAVSVRNLSARHGRRRAHHHAPTVADEQELLRVPDPSPGVDHAVLTEEANRDLLDALAALQPRWREVLLLTHVEELTVAEASRRLGITPAAFTALSYRARRALRSAYLASQQRRQPMAVA